MDQGLRLADWLGRRIQVVVDRPLGSSHPDHAPMVYQLNYGYVPDTGAPDGEPLDVYIIDADAPFDECEVEVIAIVRRRDDVEDKLVARIGSGRWDADQITARTRFQEQWFDSFIEMSESMEVFEHAYTNRTVRDGMTVVKEYLGPDAVMRATIEVKAFRALHGRVPVPEVIDRFGNTLRTGFVPGVHGKDLMVHETASSVLAACGATLRQIHAVATQTVFPEAAADLSIVHGDYGPNNVLLDSETMTTVAVLDWEWAHPGSHVEDVAWCEWIVRTFHPEHSDAMGAFYDEYGSTPGWSSRLEAMLDKLDQLRRFAERRDPSGEVAATRTRQLNVTEAWVE